MSTLNPSNPLQLSSGLPGVNRHITGHNSSGKAIVESSEPGQWQPLLQDTMAFNVVYTTSTFPPDLNNNADLQAHESVMSSGGPGLVQPHGTVCRMVDFGPNSNPLMHRTQSLDYGLVMEGEVEMELDEGVTRILKKGDVAVQRATIHAWRNTSKTEWARMFFVLQACQKLVIGGEELGEDVTQAGDHAEGLQQK